jgi:hypothetical protein
MKKIIKICGRIIKIKPSKKGYGYTLKELATGKQSYFYNNWKLNIFPKQDYIFYLNIKSGQSKYYYLYQGHTVNSISQERPKQERKNLPNLTTFFQDLLLKLNLDYQSAEFHKEQEQKEQKHEASQIKQLEARVKRLELEKQQLKNSLGNNVSYFSFVVNQQIKAIKAKPNKLTQWDQEHLKNCEDLLIQFRQQAQELKVRGIDTHIFRT